MHRMATKKKNARSHFPRPSNSELQLKYLSMAANSKCVYVCVCVRASERAICSLSRSLGLAFYTTKVKYLKTKASRKLAKRNGGDQNTDNHFVLFLSIVGFALHVRLNTRVYVCVFVQRSMLWVSVNIVLNILLFVFRKNPLTTALSFCL